MRSRAGRRRGRARSAAGAPPGERELVPRVVEIAVEPAERVSPPLRGLSDQLVAISRTRLPSSGSRLGGRMEDRRVDRVRDDHRRRAARARARGASRARTATGRSSRPRARRSPGRSTRPCRRRSRGRRRSGRRRGAPSARPRRANRRSRAEVEVERVEEARRRPAGEAVRARPSSPRPSSSRTSARRNWCPPPEGGGAKLVEEREVGASAPRARAQSSLGADPPTDGLPRPARRARDGPRLHDDTLTSPGLDALGQPSRPRHPPLAACRSRTRVGLLRLEAARRTRPRDAYALRFGGGYDLPLARRLRDRLGVSRVRRRRRRLRRRLPRAPWSSTSGAHKGYYGAYALLRGARAVVSYEPESANFALLERLGVELSGSRRRMATRDGARSAPQRGEADLHVMGASWGHALHPPERVRGARDRRRARGCRGVRRMSSPMPSIARAARA